MALGWADCCPIPSWPYTDDLSEKSWQMVLKSLPQAEVGSKKGQGGMENEQLGVSFTHVDMERMGFKLLGAL